MKRFLPVVFTCVTLAIASHASADTASGSLTVTGSVQSSMTLTLNSGAATLTGSGTGTGSVALGTISKYGTAPSGFTLTRGASDWTLSASFGVQVDKANLTSTGYTLTAQLLNAAASGVTWSIDSNTLSNSSATTLVSSGTYGSNVPHTLAVVINDSASTGAIGDEIDFTATSN